MVDFVVAEPNSAVMWFLVGFILTFFVLGSSGPGRGRF